MSSARRSAGWVVSLCAAVALGFTAFAADLPVSQDASGDIWFRTADGTTLGVSAGRDASIDGVVLVNCRQQPVAQVKRNGGEAECAMGGVEVTDRFGNELGVIGNFATGKSRGGQEWSISLDKVGAQPAGAIQLGLEDLDRVMVELGAVDKGDRIQLSLGGDILFDFDKTTVRPDAAASLAKAAQVIRQKAVGPVYVVGHTDAKGTAEHNQKLSGARAAAVIDWLGTQGGIERSRLVGSGMGATQPVAHNTTPDGRDDPAGRARNRRVEIHLATRTGVDLASALNIRVDGTGAVDVGGGAVKVDDKGATSVAGLPGMGGISVDVDDRSGNVSVGGVTTGGSVPTVHGARAVTGSATCATANNCTFDCPDGNCRLTCAAGARCQFHCAGGDCAMTCNPGGNCDFSCAGGNCRYSCPLGSACRTTCAGGDCTGS